jgi:hypothetical protein
MISKNSELFFNKNGRWYRIGTFYTEQFIKFQCGGGFK